MLSNILNWIKENPTIVIELFLLVLSLLVSIFRKKVKVYDNNLVALVKALPGLIVKAEEMYSTPKLGEEKFTFVFNASMSLLSDITGSKIDEVTSIYGDVVTKLIEDILTTPRKEVK